MSGLFFLEVGFLPRTIKGTCHRFLGQTSKQRLPLMEEDQEAYYLKN
jgi:hypothetical protein